MDMAQELGNIRIAREPHSAISAARWITIVCIGIAAGIAAYLAIFIATHVTTLTDLRSQRLTILVLALVTAGAVVAAWWFPRIGVSAGAFLALWVGFVATQSAGMNNSSTSFFDLSNVLAFAAWNAAPAMLAAALIAVSALRLWGGSRRT